MNQFRYSAALVASVMALGAFAHDARADVITYTQNAADFTSLPAPGSITNPTPDAVGGTYHVVNVGITGSVTDVNRSPFENATNVAGGVLLPDNGYGITGWGSMPYDSVQHDSSATFNFVATHTISFIWGSPDSYNTITFYSGTGGTGYLGSLSYNLLNPPTLSGDVTGSVPLDIQTFGHDVITFLDTGGFIQSIVISTGNNAFEFANLLAGPPTFQGDTPIPAALPLFATGLGVLGLFGRRRKRKNAVA